MQAYALENGKLKQSDKGPVAVLDREGLDTAQIPYAVIEWLNDDGAHSCKVEFEGNWVYGNVVMPDKENVTGEKSAFRFLCSGDRLILIRLRGDPQQYIDRLTGIKHGFSSVGDVFLTLLERLIYEDIFFVYRFEETLQKLEGVVLSGAEKGVNQALMAVSNRMKIMHAYYEQLVAMGERMEDEEFFSEERQLHTFIDKARRLDAKMWSMLDYCKQIRESFRAEMDMKLNRVMKTLTVITTLFMPVTVVSAWYGMNFRSMPELDFPYGYWIVTGITVLCTVSAILFCKKKKLL